MTIASAITDNTLPIDGEYTNAPYVSSYTLVSSQPYMENRTWSQKLVRVVRSGHRWKLNLSFNPMLRDSFELLDKFLKYKQAKGTSFYVPIGTQVSDGTLAAGTVSGTQSTRSTTINFSQDISTWASMDYFSFATSNKLYEIIDIPTTTSMRISPPLQEPVASGTALVVPGLNERPRLSAIFNGDLQYTIDHNHLYTVNLKLEEAI